ncbi:MAG: type II toxin-antitoxin system HicB family antitoxin [Phycisphaerae bacterium]|nr:type II toxin-antitoxin system HicB family antitoxin [Phycisphaerae bacterium]
MLDGEKYQVEITPDIEDGGFVAEVVELPGCITQGETLEETLEMVKDAIKTYLKPIID